MKKKKIQTHGGKRAGAGRKKKSDPIVTYSVHITAEQAALLKEWGGSSLDTGLRWLIDVARVFIRKN